MRVSPEQWSRHTDEPSIYRPPRAGDGLAHISHTKRGFHSCIHTTVLTHSLHPRFPSHINGLSLNIIWVESALRKETPTSPKRAIGPSPKHTSQGIIPCFI